MSNESEERDQGKKPDQIKKKHLFSASGIPLYPERSSALDIMSGAVYPAGQNPVVNDFVINSAVPKSLIDEWNHDRAQLTIRSDFNSPVLASAPTTMPYWDPLGALPKKEFTEDEIKQMIQAALVQTQKQGKNLTEEEIIKLINKETKEKEQTQSEIGMQVVAEKIKNGGQEIWHCAKCKAFIEKLDNLEAVTKYLDDFKIGKLKKCPTYGDNHLSWFKVVEDGILWYTKSSSESVFRKTQK